MCLQHYICIYYSQEHVICRLSEISNPKPTIKCFTKNHRLFMHNETIAIIDRLVSSYSNMHVPVLYTLGNKLRTYSRKLHTVWHVSIQYIWVSNANI